MKKALSILLSTAILFCFCACGDNNAASDTISTDENGIITKTLSVDELKTAVAGEKIRDREQKDGTRMFIDADNPLFLFRPAMPYYSIENYLETYRALPEDLKAFSAVCADKGMNAPIDELLETYEELLTKADEENIPVFLMTEVWDSADTREGFTYEQLCDLLERHPSLMGFVHVELSCSGLAQEETDRIKTTLKACKEYGAVFIWQDMEYKWPDHTNTFNRAFEDEELYNLMTEYAHNIVIQDKHNGRGRHFSVQSSAMGAWLSGVCGNWGGNIEAWLWWEMEPLDYEETGITFAEASDIYRYPPSVGGIDILCDAVGGATVFSTEELNIFRFSWNKVEFTETFWSVVYPAFQRIINGAVPDKEEVIGNVKVAYQFTSPDDLHMQDIESDLFIDTYGMTRQWYMLWNGGENSKKWLPTTGRYYIIPSLPKYANTEEILPNADILNDSNYAELFGTPQKKREYLNARYPETYTGTATLYSINGLTYIFNNNEVTNAVQNANYSFVNSGFDVSTELDLHTYMIVEDGTDGLDIELVNLRLDSLDVSTGKEDEGQFAREYLSGGKMNRKEDFRSTKIALTGLEKMPEIKLSGNNNATAEVEFNPNTKTATLTVVSNGRVLIEIVK